MKLTKIITFLLTVGILLCFCSCSDKTESWSPEIINADPYEIEYVASFNSVEEIYSAIRSSPDQYNNKKIKVFGTIFKPLSSNDKTWLLDITYLSQLKEMKKHSHLYDLHDLYEKQIEIHIRNDAQYYVMEKGDLVKLYGTLRIERDKIYIDDCTYSLVATLEERIEKFK